MIFHRSIGLWQSFVLGVLVVANSAQASLFTVEVRGVLQTESTNFHDLAGADILITYSADTTDVPTSVFSGVGSEGSVFSPFSLTLDITNRPNSAPDLADVGTINFVVHNYFPPETANDEMIFDSTLFNFNFGGITYDVEVTPVSIDFGSQSFFSGTDPVPDLSFFNSLDGSSLTPGSFYPSITVGSGVQYDVSNASITVAVDGDTGAVPEPTTFVVWPLLGLTIGGASWLRRRRAA